MDLEKMTVAEFCDELASAKSTPGGGAVAALAVELGVCLSEMVARISALKTDRDRDQTKAKAMVETYERDKASLLELVDADAQSFKKLSEAFKLPEDDPDKKKAVEEAAKAALGVSEDMIELGVATLQHMTALIEICPIELASDVATAGYMIEAGINSAWLCQLINAKSSNLEVTYLKKWFDVVVKARKDVAVLKETVERIIMRGYPNAKELMDLIVGS